ncbi:MAG: carboxypeptidase regulatory-like domain-containing protein [Gemmatimonadetes bacterium]|nr:carboxypeptidase regulatory-like domain-containing protein [Gemmatimonadota bacterium]
MSVRRRRWIAVATAGLLRVSARPAEAQVSIRGTLVDSLRGGQIVGATIQLLGASRSTTTDRQGRFQFEGLGAGPWRLGYWAPWLDSLGLPAIERAIPAQSAGSITITLATPSLATYQAARCGTRLPDGQGILLGEIRGADGEPIGSAGVSARWEETRLGRGMLDRSPMATIDSTSGDGMFFLCGVPVGSEVTVRATAGERGRSSEVVVRIGSAVQRRDLTIAPVTLTTRLRGRVLNESGAPIALAAIVPLGDSLLSARTDSTGTFTLDGWPRRSSQLLVRALGFEPRTLDIEPTEAVVDLDTLQLSRIPPQLAAVFIEGREVSVEELEFDARRRLGLGTHLGDKELGRLPIISVDAVGNMIPRAQVIGNAFTRQIVFRRVTMTAGTMSQFCSPQFWIDGVNVRNLEPDEQSLYIRNAKRIEAYVANVAPPRFTDFNGCGSVVIWTR